MPFTPPKARNPFKKKEEDIDNRQSIAPEIEAGGFLFDGTVFDPQGRRIGGAPSKVGPNVAQDPNFLAQPESILDQGPKIFTDPRTGRTSGIQTTGGRTFLGVNQQEVGSILQGQAQQTGIPAEQPTGFFGTTDREALREEVARTGALAPAPLIGETNLLDTGAGVLLPFIENNLRGLSQSEKENLLLKAEQMGVVDPSDPAFSKLVEQAYRKKNSVLFSDLVEEGIFKNAAFRKEATKAVPVVGDIAEEFLRDPETFAKETQSQIGRIGEAISAASEFADPQNALSAINSAERQLLKDMFDLRQEIAYNPQLKRNDLIDDIENEIDVLRIDMYEAREKIAQRIIQQRTGITDQMNQQILLTEFKDIERG